MTEKLLKGETLSSGVDELIARLRDEGVAAGREEAARLVADAREEARRIVGNARAEARETLEAARKEADTYSAAGHEALKTAMRDAVLGMRADLMQRFSADVKRLVARDLEDPEIMRKMILEVAGRARASAGIGDEGPLEIVLPAQVAGLEELRQDPEELHSGRLTKLVLGLAGSMLREGVTFRVSEDAAKGIRVVASDQDVVLDLTEDAIVALLLRHLQPRFRAVLEGVVK